MPIVEVEPVRLRNKRYKLLQGGEICPAFPYDSRQRLIKLPVLKMI